MRRQRLLDRKTRAATIRAARARWHRRIFYANDSKREPVAVIHSTSSSDPDIAATVEIPILTPLNNNNGAGDGANLTPVSETFSAASEAKTESRIEFNAEEKTSTTILAAAVQIPRSSSSTESKAGSSSPRLAVPSHSEDTKQNEDHQTKEDNE